MKLEDLRDQKVIPEQLAYWGHKVQPVLSVELDLRERPEQVARMDCKDRLELPDLTARLDRWVYKAHKE